MNDADFARHLDRLRETRQSAPDHLATRILANLPSREPLEELFAWFSRSLLRGAVTALIPLLVGFGLGSSLNMDAESPDTWYEAESLVYGEILEEYDYDEI